MATPWYQTYAAPMLDGRWFLTAFVLACCVGCGVEPQEKWQALEVQHCIGEALGLTLREEKPDRAKALAVQAVNLAGDNQRLVAVGQLAAGWAEIMRGDKRMGARFIRKALEGMEPSMRTNDILLWAARSHQQESRPTEARELLDWWRSRMDPEVHAHLVRPVVALSRELEKPRKPMPPVLLLEDLLKQ